MTAKSEIFSHLNFVLIAKDVSAESVSQTVKLLKEHAADDCIVLTPEDLCNPMESEKQAFLNQFKHDIHCIISSTSDFWFYRLAAFDFLIPVVRPEWVQACVSTKRITRASCFSPDPLHVLMNFQIYISKHSLNSSEYDLYAAMITSLGAVCIDYLSSRATHIVTVDPQDPAIAAVANVGGLNIKYVLPTWIIEVFKDQKYRDETKHLLDPRERPEAIKSKMADLWNEIDIQKFSSHYDFLLNHRIFLSLDLILPTNCYNFLIDFVKSAGGEVVRHLDRQDICKASGDCYIGRFTKSQEYEQAKSENLHAGNVPWLFYMWSMQKFINPKQKLLLSPLKPGIFKRSELILSYTNYLGPQRSYVQKLVDALGGISTTELMRKNTHLLSCMPFGQKYRAALRWKDTCKIVNHFWLEECYRSGQKLDCCIDRFENVDISDGLPARLGQLPLDDERDALEIPGEDMVETLEAHDSEQKHIIKESDESKLPEEGTEIFKFTTNAPPSDDTKKSKSFEDHAILHSDQLGEEIDKKDERLSPEKVISLEVHQEKIEKVMNNVVENGETIIQTISQQSPIIDSFHLNSTTSSTSAGLHFEELNRTENTTTPSPVPVISSQLMSSGTREAKKKATIKLHTDMELLNEFERNSKRKKTSGLLPEELERLKKMKGLEDRIKELLENAGIDSPKGRRSRPYNINAVCTGCHERIDDLDMELLRRLGVVITTEVTPQSNAVIAPKKMRTAKFLISFSFHPLKYVLLPNFVTDLLGKIRDGSPGCVLPSVEDYFVADIDTLTLQKTHLKTKVFQRAGLIEINLVSDIAGGCDIISSILKAHGVQKVNVLPNKFENENIVVNKNTNNAPKYVLIAQKASQAKKFTKLCQKKGGGTIMVVEWNWCVKAIFGLNIDFDNQEYVICKK